MNFILRYKTELIIILLSLVIHFALFAVMVEKKGSVVDVVRVDDGYFELAQNVLAGNGFSWSTEAPYEPNPLRTPGYIYVLALLMSIVGITGAAIVQLITSALIPIFGMYISSCLTQSRKVSIFTGVILALDPTLALLSFQFYTDTLFLLLFLPWLLLTVHYAKNPTLRTLIACAALLGIAILVRPVVQYVPILIALCIVWQFRKDAWQKSVTHIGIYFFIVGAILSPWVVRNIITFNTPGLSAQTSFVLYTNLAPAVKSVAEGANFIDVRNSFLTFREYKGDAITLENGEEYTQKAVTILKEYPEATLYVLSKSVFTFFTNDGFHTLIAQLRYNPRDYLVLLIVARCIWILITLTALVGACIYLFKNRTSFALLMVLLVAYFAVTSTIAGFGTNPRYRLPVDPIIISLASIGAIYTLKWIQRFNIILKIKMLVVRDSI